jgi:hypothetical protein
MALSLANMLTRVKRYVPTTTMDTELQDSLLERMNYLVSIDTFPFQELYQNFDVVIGDWRVDTPVNFATIKDLVIYTADSERPLDRLDATEFDRLFPMPANLGAAEPIYYCIKVAEGEIWFNCPTDKVYTFRIYFYAIPDDATDPTVSQMVELAKLVLVKWGSADGFRMIGEYDRATVMEEEGNKMLAALKKRYQLAQEEGARFISPKTQKELYKGY